MKTEVFEALWDLRAVALQGATDKQAEKAAHAAYDAISNELRALEAATVDIRSTLPWWEGRNRPYADGAILAKQVRDILKRLEEA